MQKETDSSSRRWVMSLQRDEAREGPETLLGEPGYILPALRKGYPVWLTREP